MVELKDKFLDWLMDNENPMYIIIFEHKPRFIYFGIAAILILLFLITMMIVDFPGVVGGIIIGAILALIAGTGIYHTISYIKWEKKILKMNEEFEE